MHAAALSHTGWGEFGPCIPPRVQPRCCSPHRQRAPHLLGVQASSVDDTIFCFDTATMYAETLPLAAPPPDSCSTNITISPLSTVEVYSGISRQALRLSLGLSSEYPAAYNAYSVRSCPAGTAVDLGLTQCQTQACNPHPHSFLPCPLRRRSAAVRLRCWRWARRSASRPWSCHPSVPSI